jgi:hypothetical protein
MTDTVEDRRDIFDSLVAEQSREALSSEPAPVTPRRRRKNG